GNVGSGTVREMYEWIEYLTFDKKSTLTSLREENGKKDPWKVKYWGIGNENWGCGGNMRVEYYTDLIAQYSTYCKNYGENKLYKIVSGPTGEMELDFITHWYEVLMNRRMKFRLGDALFHAISLHYYTRAGFLGATKFNDKKWFLTMKNALYMDTLITTIDDIMSKSDPNKQIGLVVDEWGTWWAVEPGTNPNFLYQQNTMRDALVASLHLDIFNNHCDRVSMANIAQTINVLQAMVLTQDEKMILTPTYHVFDMYKIHQDATLLPIELKSEPYIGGKRKKEEIPAIHGSASLDQDDKVHISLCNIDPNNNIEVSIEIFGINMNNRKISAQILRGDDMKSHNTFENPNNVVPVEFNSEKFSTKESNIVFEMPSMSIIVIEIN
ncbi:MAG: alpha-N-arabinofuranosidase, partial [archaeon]|nr:alpha-N-arabinofuranosidase [archaeon]